MGALGLRLHDFFDMSWYEYQIMSKGYEDIQKEEWKKVKFIAYHSLIGPHREPKSLPKSFDDFLKLFEPKKVKKADSVSRQKLLEQYKAFQNVTK